MKFVWCLLDNYALSYTDFSAQTFVVWQVVATSDTPVVDKQYLVAKSTDIHN